MRRLPKLLGLAAGIALLDIIVLSPGLVGVRIGGGHALETAFGVTFVFMSVVTLLYGTYKLLLRPQQGAAPAITPLETSGDYVEALRRHKNARSLRGYVEHALDQIDRMSRKQESLLEVLGRRFDPSELSYRKFNTVIDDVHRLFFLNVRGMLNKLEAFDATEYDRFAGEDRPAHLSDRLLRERSELYRQYMTYVAGAIGTNEEILLKLDKLLLEIARLDSLDIQAIEAMPGMMEIDELIRQTKFYRT